MRALTIKQPWADAIVHGTKRTENRTWQTTHRGPVIIHAGAGYDQHAGRIIPDLHALSTWPDTRGAVLATADLTDVHYSADGECCPTWGEANTYHWVLDNIRPLAAPVPAKGRLGLWIPAADLLAAVNDQPEAMS